VVLLWCAGSAGGAPVVYHSPNDDGLDPGAPVFLTGAPFESLFLYADAGPLYSTLGEVCLDGNGDELCAWVFRLGTSGTISIYDFVPDSGQDIVWTATSNELSAQGGDAEVGELGPIRLGELILQVAGAGGGQAEIFEGYAVSAQLTLETVSPRVVALPEPSFLLQICAGVGFLLALDRRRRRLLR
jgi:hypothetical protein